MILERTDVVKIDERGRKDSGHISGRKDSGHISVLMIELPRQLVLAIETEQQLDQMELERKQQLQQQRQVCGWYVAQLSLYCQCPNKLLAFFYAIDAQPRPVWRTNSAITGSVGNKK